MGKRGGTGKFREIHGKEKEKFQRKRSVWNQLKKNVTIPSDGKKGGVSEWWGYHVVGGKSRGDRNCFGGQCVEGNHKRGIVRVESVGYRTSETGGWEFPEKQKQRGGTRPYERRERTGGRGERKKNKGNKGARK